MKARGFGLAAALPPEVLRLVARACEAHGYRTFWVNDTPEGDGLLALAQAAQVTSTIALGVGVLPLTRWDPKEIAERVQELALPLERLRLGIGSGVGSGALERVRHGARVLRLVLCELVVAALGPRMCRLAGEVADAVLWNWLTPAWAQRSAEWLNEGAQRVHRTRPRRYAYVRVALSQDSLVRLEEEARRYERFAGYREHFQRMGVAVKDTAIAVRTRAELNSALAPWEEVLDETVIRAITAHDQIEEILALVEAGSPTAAQV